jgi:hypothetical protein
MYKFMMVQKGGVRDGADVGVTKIGRRLSVLND